MSTRDHASEAAISWDHPAPQSAFDRFVGPGATGAELALQFVPTALITAAWITVAIVADWGWSAVQLVVAAVVMLDMIGGVVTNATSAAKRWYHRPGQGSGAHLGFVAIHFVQPLAVMLLFDRWNWLFVGAAYGYLLLASLAILAVPLYLRRPLAGVLVVIGFFLAFYALPVPPRFEWFLPVFFVKILSSHLLREEPYRPASNTPGGRA